MILRAGAKSPRPIEVIVSQPPSPAAPAPETACLQVLLRRLALALAACAVLVALCYFLVDRPVAFFVHQRGIERSTLLEWLTHLPMFLNALAALLVVLGVIRAAWGPFTRLERTAFAASLSLIVAIALEYYLKFLCGRYWPETWVDNNPSLIGSGAYGFHPFHFGEAYGSFPSGHTTRACAFVGVFWVAYPRWRWLCGLGVAAVVVGLVGRNYHFVGDTVGGAFLGGLTAMYTAALCRVTDGPERP
jgi:membrane-associated phospholipid phosphatase